MGSASCSNPSDDLLTTLDEVRTAQVLINQTADRRVR
jgi:hypothetical protein